MSEEGTEENKKNQIYGLYFDRKIEKEDVIRKCLNNIPILVHDSSKDVVKDFSDNILIEGDNFFALSALNQVYPNGFVDVIYIDPPYNTGNNDFQYNDKFVDEEDSYHHSKWLSFMEARLNLAKNLLKDDGVIYISIDEHEFAQLKLLCDNVLGEHNFIENFIWIKNATKNLSKTTSTNHEYILCYCKDKNTVEKEEIFRINKPGFNDVQNILDCAKEQHLTVEQAQRLLDSFYSQRKDLKGVSSYDLVEIQKDPETGDSIYRAFTLADLSAPKATGVGETYDIIHPITGKPCKTPSRGWLYKKDKMDECIKNNLIYFYDDETHVPRYKRYLDSVSTEVMKSVIVDNNDGKKELMKIFNGNAPFSNSKPVSLLKTLFAISKKDSVIMDFFAGSGTTAQAVIELNKEDGGNRKFILCTNNENNIMSDVCYPRVKTVITGKREDGSSYSDGLPSSVRYFKTDFVEDSILKEQAKYSLVEQCDGLLCILEGCYDICNEGQSYNIYLNSSKNKSLSIFNDNFDDKLFSEMLEKVNKTNVEENVVYYFSLDSNIDTSIEKKVLEKVSNAVVKPIPSKIYEIYKKIVDEAERIY